MEAVTEPGSEIIFMGGEVKVAEADLLEAEIKSPLSNSGFYFFHLSAVPVCIEAVSGIYLH